MSSNTIMIFILSYNSLTITNYVSCVVEIDMEKLILANFALYEWISNVQNGVASIDLSRSIDREMYDTIVDDARKNNTGCIKALAHTKLDVYAKSTRGLDAVCKSNTQPKRSKYNVFIGAKIKELKELL